MNAQKTSRVLLIVVLTTVVYIVDALTGMIPDVSGLYLIGVVLATAWFGLVPGLIVAAVALSADIIVHPAALRFEVFFHNITHLMTYSFAAYITSALTKQLSLVRSLETRRDYELAIARRAADTVLNKHVISEDNRFDVSASSRSARELGGDLVLVRDTQAGLAVCVADISGKGVSAALFSTLLLSQVSDAINDSPSPESVVERVNARMSESLPEEMFVTIIYCLLDGESLTLVNAGHEAALMRTVTGEVMMVPPVPTGMPLGVTRDLTVESLSVPFPPGTTLMCHSDGITDSAGFEGDRGLVHEWFASATFETASQLSEAMLAYAAPDSSPQRDDMSILVVRAVS